MVAAFLAGALIATAILFFFVASKRLNAKSDEIVARFSESLGAKEAQISTQIANYYRLQTEQFNSNTVALSTQFADNLNAKATEVANAFRTQADQAIVAKTAELMGGISNSLQNQFANLASSVQSIQADLYRPAKERADKQSTLLAAAHKYDKESHPELAELCYLAAFSLNAPDSSPVLKQYLASKEAAVAAAPDTIIATNGPEILLGLLQTLDKALPQTQASPSEMENALATVERIKASIARRQALQLEALASTLQWTTFAPTNLQAYITARQSLAAISPASPGIEAACADAQDRADALIQTAKALAPDSLSELLPPATAAPDSIQTNWYENALLLLHQRTNTTEAKLVAFTVLHDYTISHSNNPACQGYLNQLDAEATILASQQWLDRREEFSEFRTAKLKADAETLAVGQALLNQGLELAHSCSNRPLVALVTDNLAPLAKEVFLHREMMLQDMIAALPSQTVPEEKQNRARARSMLAGQVLAATIDLRAAQKDLEKLQCSASGEDDTTQLLGRLEADLTAFEKEDSADSKDAQANHLQKQLQQFARYANFCEQKISSARWHFNKAEELASEWFRTRSNGQVQHHYRKGLEDLYSVDKNDLDRVNMGIGGQRQLLVVADDNYK